MIVFLLLQWNKIQHSLYSSISGSSLLNDALAAYIVRIPCINQNEELGYHRIFCIHFLYKLECKKRMLSTESGDNRVLRSEIVLPAELNARSLAELDAGIDKIHYIVTHIVYDLYNIMIGLI